MTLNKMDSYLLQNIERIESSGYKDENPRGRYESDGEPSHCISIRGGVYEIFDIEKGELPVTLTRQIPLKSTIGEIMTFYKDQSNKIEDFEKNKCGFWKQWDIGDGTIGGRYSYTIKEYDQMNTLLKGLVEDPFSKRHVIDLWQLEHLNKLEGLKPCWWSSMWTVSVVDGEKYLDLTLISRSSDLLVAGTGINQLGYVALQMMVSKHCGYKVGLFETYRKNVHVYDRHLPQLEETIKRLINMSEDKILRTPQLILNVPDGTNFYDIEIDDFELINYEPIKPQLEKFDLAI